MDIKITNYFVRLVIGPDARVKQFVDMKTGKDYIAPDSRPFACIKKGGKEYAADAASQTKHRITLRFGGSGASAVIEARAHKRHIALEVISVTGKGVEELTFGDIRLSLKGARDETFAACMLALNVDTRVDELPKPSSHLKAICYSRLGLAGAKVAIIGCPTKDLRKVMQEVVMASPDLPHSPVGGPWALDSPRNRESYLFNFGDLTEKTVDEWIELAKNLGIRQIDFHGGGSFRFGDCTPNPAMYPQGRASFKAVIDRLHEAGILAGLHTYAFFIDKSSPWITPKPDPGLGKDAVFTLAKPISESDTDVPVVEDTKDMSAVTGFFVQNSVIVQVDDELIVYSGISKQAPYAFTGCQRGALGTKASAHAAGAKVGHLTECFGYLAPDPDSELFTRVAQATADFYNECGFDMVYLDALDGEGVLGGPQWGWHYGSKFVFELFKRLTKPPIMEMSIFHHHLWYVRSRMGAWDHPNRSYKLFVDTHCQANGNCRDMFLPEHLGWWRITAGADPRVEPTFADDIDYLCAKCAAHDCGLSPQGFTPESWAASPNLRRLGGIIRRWEDARLSGAFGEADKAELAVPGAEYTLVEKSGKPVLAPVQYLKHKVEGVDSPTSRWTVTSSFASQPAKLRIQALYSAAPYDSTAAVTVTDFGDTALFARREVCQGVSASISTSNDQVKAGEASALITAERAAGTQAQPQTDTYSVLEHGQRKQSGGDASWAQFGATFSPPLDLSKNRALGVWVYGDGLGEVINIQMKNPSNMVGGIADHYIVVDFTGWRYFELIEPEGDRIERYNWPYGQNVYGLYRELVDPAHIESFSIWVNNLPVAKPISCYLGPIKALPLVAAKLVNPSVTIGGKTITFPVTLETGQYIEYASASDCKVYDAQGNPVADVKPVGDAPTLATAANDVSFACDALPDGMNARAMVTVIGEGK